jgi:hypothetical protein
VVTIFDVVEADGSPWIVMELVEARSLDQVLTEDGPLRPQEAADLGMRVLGALACAHAAGILHRDVKPSNVLLGPDGRAVLTDFGIATLEGDSGLTQAGMVMGTPGFTAPERIRGDPASPASDLWSLGATLYAAVEGRGPFDNRGNSIAILAAIANEDPPRPRSAGPLRPVIEALLHRTPQARPDAAAAARLLGDAGTGTTAGTEASGDAGWQAARAGTPLLAAPLDLRAAGPQTQAPADGVSWPVAPWPDGPWPDDLWRDDLWPDDLWRDDPWAGDRPRPGGAPWGSPAPQPGGLSSAGPQAAGPPRAVARAAGPQAAGPRAAGPQARRHGAPAPGLRRGLTAEVAAMLPRGRRGLLVLVGALAIVGVGILVGVSLTSGSSSTGAPARPGGPQAVTVNRAGSGSAFTMTVPAGWRTAQRGTGTDFTSPGGEASILVTPTAAGGATDPARLRRQLAQALRRGGFPGYRPVGARPFTFRGGAEAAWQFTWQPASGGRMEVRDIAFRLVTPAGRQAYRVQESAPAAAWAAAQPVFRNALSTFRAGS